MPNILNHIYNFINVDNIQKAFRMVRNQEIKIFWDVLCSCQERQKDIEIIYKWNNYGDCKTYKKTFQDFIEIFFFFPCIPCSEKVLLIANKSKWEKTFTSLH